MEMDANRWEYMGGLGPSHGLNDGADQPPPASSMISFLLAEYRDVSEEFVVQELQPFLEEDVQISSSPLRVSTAPRRSDSEETMMTPSKGILRSPNHFRRMTHVRFDSASPRTRLFWPARPSPANSPTGCDPSKKQSALSFSPPQLTAKNHPPSPTDELSPREGDLAAERCTPAMDPGGDARGVMHALRAADFFPPRPGPTLPTPAVAACSDSGEDRPEAGGVGQEWLSSPQEEQLFMQVLLLLLPSFLAVPSLSI
ncbi:hypothetical protein T484DRAFT_1812496 [Baffinella frigidus]|nr:hypothetical protein T484DRAFT_1812496 [Cryptophyta sp. CCMP2293]